jgi:hypothetical protein
MGTLKAFNLIELKEKYKLNCLVETGTFTGDGIQLGLDAGFKEIYSCEIDLKFYNDACIRFTVNENVFLENISSEIFLEHIEYLIKPNNNNILFWLDAHLPDIKNADKTLMFPLQKELEIIKDVRNISKDVFIIDDLRIYEDGNFGHGNYENRDINMNSGFIYSNLLPTHNIEKDYRHEGYLICTPK